MAILPSLIVLGLAALAAARLASTRSSPAGQAEQRRSAAKALLLATTAQAVHFAEEASTGFHDQLGPLLGLPGMPVSGFVLFNLLWLGIWLAAVPGLRSNRPAAFFAAWFLAIAGVLNGVLHPLLATMAGGYFPGLLSSLLIALAGAWLWIRLVRATQADGKPPPHP